MRRRLARAMARTRALNGQRPRKKVVFVCLQGGWSGGVVKIFRVFLRRHGLEKQISVFKAGARTKRFASVLSGAHSVVSVYFGAPTLEKIYPEAGWRNIRRLAPRAIRINPVYKTRGGHPLNILDLDRTFGAILKSFKGGGKK